MTSRSEVGDEVLTAVKRALRAKDPIAGWKVDLKSVEGGYTFGLAHSGQELVRCWFCIERDASDRLFEDASSHTLDERVIIPRPKGSPWLAVAIMPTALGPALANPELLFEAGDLERCVAWALLDNLNR